MRDCFSGRGLGCGLRPGLGLGPWLRLGFRTRLRLGRGFGFGFRLWRWLGRGEDSGDFLNGTGIHLDFLQVRFFHPYGGGRGRADLTPFAFFAARHDRRATLQRANDIILNARPGAELDASGDHPVAFNKVFVQPQADAVGRRQGRPVAFHPADKQNFAHVGAAEPLGVGRWA